MIDLLLQLPAEEKIHLVLACITTVSMLFAWNRLESNLKIIVLYPLAHFAEKVSLLTIFHRPNPKTPFVYTYENELATVAYAVLAVFFYLSIVHKSLRTKILVSIPLFWVLSHIVIMTAIWEPVNKVTSFARIAGIIFLIYCCFTYFQELLNHDMQYGPEKDRVFWFVVGLLFYFVGHFFILGVLKYIGSTNKALSINIASIEYILDYVLYGVLVSLSLIKFPLINYE